MRHTRDILRHSEWGHTDSYRNIEVGIQRQRHTYR